MNTKVFTVLFIIASVASATNLNLRPTFNIMAEIKKVEDTEFGAKLMDTIALQLGNKAPLQDVANLLKHLRENLNKQQAEATELHNSREAECKSEIAEYNRRIKVATAEIADAVAQIGSLTQQISQLEAAIANKKRQLVILGERDVSLTKQHNADRAAFQKRSADHTNVLEALDIIIPKLKNIPPEPKQKEAVFAELANIGKSNPIAALVQVASTMDANALANVINKLQEIRNSVAASLKDDQDAQAKSNEEYKTLSEENTTVTANVQAALKQDEADLADAQSKKQFQENRRDEQQAELDSAQKGLAAKEAQCQAWREQYKKDSEQRAKEVAVVVQVEQILATRLESMKGYLKDRVNK